MLVSRHRELFFLPTLFQNAISQADSSGAIVPLTPHITAKSANLLVILHAESSLAYAFEVGSLRFFLAASAFGGWHHHGGSAILGLRVRVGEVGQQLLSLKIPLLNLNRKRTVHQWQGFYRKKLAPPSCISSAKTNIFCDRLCLMRHFRHYHVCPKRRRCFWAAASPHSAALRYHFTASCSFFSTPVPSA